MHYQEYLQIGLCIEGEGKFLLAEKSYDVKVNDIILVDNFEKHVAVSDPPAATKYLFVIFFPDLIAPPGSRFFDFEYLSPFWYDSSSFCHKIEGDTETARIVSDLMFQCKNAWDRKEKGYTHCIDANLRRILAGLMRHYGTFEPEISAKRIKNYIKVQEAIDYIMKHFSETVTLEDVSSIVHMSQSRFRHVFKEVTRLGFKEYIISRRLNEAKRRLLMTEENIVDVMYTVGFSNISQFYQAFQKETSMTPADFRNHYRKSDKTTLYLKFDRIRK